MIPQFSMICFASAIEPLRVSNRMGGRKIFTWNLVSETGEPVQSSNGTRLMVDYSLQDVDFASVILVCSSFQPELYETKSLLAWLVRQARNGACLGALDTGSHILATAGLLNKYRVTMHWESIPAFEEEFPFIEVTHRKFEIDRDRFTCAGGTACLDMFLSLIQSQFGREFALNVSEQFIYQNREAFSDQKMDTIYKLDLHNSKLLSVIEIMESNIEEPLDCEYLASLVNISRRQLERLFKAYLDASPAKYYSKLRLTRGKQLLQQSKLTITEISIACGFMSSSDFSRAYKNFWGVPPCRDRQIQQG